jgi:Predicted integral membrane protein (DUF2269)
MTLYFIFKYLHVLGAIVILGTGTGIAFFMLMAHRSRDVAFIARTGATVVFADMVFTLSAVVLQPLSGRAFLDSGGLHANGNARFGACGRGREPAVAAALLRAVSPLVHVRNSRIRFGHDHPLADDRQAGVLGRAWLRRRRSWCSGPPA